MDGIDGAEVDGSADVCTEDGLRVGATDGFNDGFMVDGSNDVEYELTKDGRPDVGINVREREGADEDDLVEGVLDGRIDGALVDIIETTTDGKQVGKKDEI